MEKMPEDVRTNFQELSIQLTRELKSVEEAAKNSTQPIEKDVRQVCEMLNMLIFKPSIKGVASERALELLWQENFPADEVQQIGGSGAPDLMITPYLSEGDHLGQRILIERKTGQKRRYSGGDLHQTLRLAIKEGVKFAVLVYDLDENLTQSQKPFFLTTIEDVILAVCSVESAGWRTARQVFEVMQSAMVNTEIDKTRILDYQQSPNSS